MLEDSNIQHLISWSPSNDSFVVAPTGEFSKVLRYVFLCLHRFLAQTNSGTANTLSIPIFHRLYASSTCTVFIRVGILCLDFGPREPDLTQSMMYSILVHPTLRFGSSSTETEASSVGTWSVCEKSSAEHLDML